MSLSSNQAVKKTFTTGTNSSISPIDVSSNLGVKKEFEKSYLVASGENTASSAFGSEDLFGGPFSVLGGGHHGGLSHFKNQTRYTISH